MRVCRACEKEKQDAEFGKDCKSKDGVSNRCKSCNNLREKEKRKKNPELFRRRDRIAYLKKPPRTREQREKDYKKTKERNRKRFENDPDYYKKIYQKNRVSILSYVRERYRKNPDKFKTKLSAPEKYFARTKLNNEILMGRINRPDNCESCRKLCKTDAHHPDYSKPLEVKWLCRQCHCRTHKIGN